jgi:hypothetical protein
MTASPSRSPALRQVLGLLFVAASCLTPGRAHGQVPADSVGGVATGGVSDSSQFGRIALVDIPLVWLLHPDMTEFIVEEDSFLRPLPPGTPPANGPAISKERFQQAERLVRNARESNTNAEREIRKLELEQFSLSNRLDMEQEQLRRKLRQDLARTPARRSDLEAKFGLEQKQLETGAWSRRKVIQDTVLKLRREMQKRYEDARACMFLTAVERDQRFRTMMTQIEQAIDAVTAGRYTVVVNRGYLGAVRRGPAPSSAQADGYTPHPVESYINYYHAFWTREVKKEDVQSNFLVENELVQWLQDRNRITPALPAELDLFGFVIRGGDDITEKVLEKVLSGQNLPEERIAALMKYVKSL